MRDKRKADFITEEEIQFEEEIGDSKEMYRIKMPKDIIKLLEEFGVERTSLDELNLVVNEENILEGIYTKEDVE